MGMRELTVVVDLSSKIGIIFGRGFEDDFRTVGEGVASEINLAEGPFAYYAA